jgi:Uma2 family endonuclease
MTIAAKPIFSARGLPDLHSGDRLSREEFHRIYQRTPEGFKAELIGGIVYVASPLKIPHGTSHPYLTAAFFLYAGKTPGVEVGDNTTILLGEEGEPQPDLYLRILPEYGGQSKTTIDDQNGEDEFVDGAPELIAEIAHSSAAIDLHSKREDYRRYGSVNTSCCRSGSGNSAGSTCRMIRS